jgi:tRNA pseudouridine55 synthase
MGAATTTGDAEGEVIERGPTDMTEADVRAILQRFRGEIEQVPPMFSALKRDGVPLYKLARRGQEVERAPRRVTILELEMTGGVPLCPELRVRCSKGTYIRSLAEDIGIALGSRAHLSALRRTASGRFRIEDAVTLGHLGTMGPAERRQRLRSLADLLVGFPRAELDAPAAARLRNGQALAIPGLSEGVYGVYDPEGAVIGLGRSDGATLHPLRLTQTTEKHR